MKRISSAFVCFSLCGLLLSSRAAAAEPAASALIASPLGSASGPRGATLFAEMASEQTGIVTENRYDDAAMWNERYAEFTVGPLGTGVAIGDYDNDGRPDIFVVSKTESCRLFRNASGWKFEDTTEKAGVSDAGAAAKIWKQGATFVDVNNDGWLDLYVCRFDAPNLLYINRGDGTFSEEAERRGLAVNDASVMGAFCDYDRDGWLDVFVQTNRPESIERRFAQQNYLFRNKGDGTFVDVTARAGISGKAQGHSAIWWDHDSDGWPDLYVANDFTPPDRLYRNNRDGTFTDVVETAVPHTPFSSMGADLGDVNNDGLIDLLVADMAATTHQKDQRTMANARSLIVEPPDGSTASPFIMRNALYLNTGVGRMLEAACLAGVDATDWTWSVRFEDLDNDGRLDLHVTNGMHREPHNADLMARIAAAQSILEKIRIERASPVLAEANLAYRSAGQQSGDLRFEDVSAAWGLNQNGVSFGAAFGDLDGDGDLDLVFSNYRKGVTVLRNDGTEGNRVLVQLRGTRSNRFGVGAIVRVETETGVQVRSLVLARGVLSSSEPVLHFGLGADSRIKRLTVVWPDGRSQSFSDLAANQRFTITEPTGLAVLPPETRQPDGGGQFVEVSETTRLSWRARESSLDEVAQQPLLPMRQNRRGPALVVADLSGDGIDDVVVGGTPLDPMRLFVADVAAPMRFRARETEWFVTDEKLSDGPLLAFDADGDGANDLLTTKRGVARPEGAPEYQPKLFLNDRSGGFREAKGAMPPFTSSVGAVAAADFDRSGRLGLFLGGRVVPGRYPLAPASALLVNRGGRFEDATERLAPALRNIGMVTAALWTDADADGWLDLMLTLEWGDVKLFRNREGKRFEDVSEPAGFASAGTGWWTALAAADFNGDGRMDYVAGNVGLNTPYRADPAHPILIFAGDFSGRGGEQLIEAYYQAEALYPRRSRRELAVVFPALLKRFPRNDLFARATLPEIFGDDNLSAARRFAATELRSGVFLSEPNGKHRFQPLPRLLQVAPVQGLAAGDFDGDGRADIYAVHNSYAAIPSVGRFDGGLSQFLRGDGRGSFIVVPTRESGLVVPGDGEGLAVIDLGEDGWPDFVVSRNNEASLVFRNRGVGGRNPLEVRLRAAGGNPSAIGAHVVLELADGTTQAAEVHADSGYYSQSAPACHFGWPDSNPPRRLRVRWPSGQQTEHSLADEKPRVLISAPE